MTLPLTAIILFHKKNSAVLDAIASLQWAEKILLIDNQQESTVQMTEAELLHAGVTEVRRVAEQVSNFANHRNLAMSMVKTEWCFFLDSDELVELPSEAEFAELRDFMSDSTVSGIAVKRSDVFLGKKLSYGEASRQSLIRFVRTSGTTWQGAAHERPVITGEVRNSLLSISHYSHESINSFISDVGVYAKIIAKERMHSSTTNLAQLMLFPPVKLLYDLIVLGGILDGWRGVVYSYCMALHSLLVRIYWYEGHAGLVSQAKSDQAS